MSGERSIRHQLEAASRARVPQPWRADTPHGRITIHVDATGTIGLSFRNLTYESPRLLTLPAPRLQEFCARLAERMTYLLEPIRVTETDEELRTVQMRSHPPSTDGGSIGYFELLARAGGQLCLVRYRKSPGQSREVIASEVTFQVLERMVRDFDAAAAEV